MPSSSKKLPLLIPLVLLIMSCTLSHETTAFLSHGDEFVKEGKLPADGSWIGDEQLLIDTARKAQKIFIADVNTDNAVKKVDASKGFERFKTYRREEIAEMGRYMKERFRASIIEEAKRPIEVVEAPAPDALIVQLAIVEVIPTNAIAGILGTVGGVFLPGAGVATFLAQGTIAMEGKVLDGATNGVLFEWKDRASDKNTLFSIKDYQQYAHIRSVIDTWARQFAQLHSRDFEGEVKSDIPFTLNPL